MKAKAKAKTKAKAKARANDLALSPALAKWLVESAIRGASVADLTAELVARGVPRVSARHEVTALLRSPLVDVVVTLMRRAGRIEQVLALRRQVASKSVERRANLSSEEFYRSYFEANMPVIITDVVERWPAFERWSFSYLRERVGDVPLEVCRGRLRVKHPEAQFAEVTETMPLSRFLDLVEGAGVTNDLYMIAKNRALEKDELRVPLLADIGFAPFLDPQPPPGSMSLWIGPAGTVTPLHHDTVNILFCQVRGTKRFRLVSNLDVAVLDGAVGHNAGAGVDSLDPQTVFDVTLHAGEALFIPVGWWHHVEALSLSVSWSFMGFQRPNRFAWYAPGRIFPSAYSSRR